MTRTPAHKRKKYLAGKKPDYGNDVLRVQDELDIFYCFIYTQNNSPYRLREDVYTNAKDLEVLYPPMPPVSGEADPEVPVPIVLDIPAGGDHCIVLRVKNHKYSWACMQNTHDREE